MSDSAAGGPPVISAGVIVADHLTPPIDRLPGRGSW